MIVSYVHRQKKKKKLCINNFDDELQPEKYRVVCNKFVAIIYLFFSKGLQGTECHMFSLGMQEQINWKTGNYYLLM